MILPCYLMHGLPANIHLWTALAFVASLVPIAILDFRTRVIPDRYMVPSILLALAAGFARDPSYSRDWTIGLVWLVSGGLFAALPLLLLYVLRQDLGGADVKMALAAGFWGGADRALLLLLCSCLLTVLVCLASRVRSRLGRGRSREAAGAEPGPAQTLPLLPAVCLALALAVIYDLLKQAEYR